MAKIIFLPVKSDIMDGLFWVEFILYFYKEKLLVLITLGYSFHNLNKNTVILLLQILAIVYNRDFIIPSSFREELRTLLIGDFIFVSKVHYV